MPSKQIIDIPYPLAGLEEYRAITAGRVFNGRTSAASTQSALNARGIDSGSGRARGGSRPGLTKFHASQINGSESIQDIVPLVGAALGTQRFIGQSIAMIAPAAAARGPGLFTATGTSHSTDTSLSVSDTLGPSCWDDSGHCYFAWRENSSSKFKISRRQTDTITNTDWTTSAFSASSASTPYIPIGIAVYGTTLYFYCQTSGANNWEIWRFNATTGANLDSGSPWKTEGGGHLAGLETHSTGTAIVDNTLAVSNGNIAVLEMRTGINGFVRIFNSAGTQLARTQVIASSTGANSYMVNIVGDGSGGFYWCGVENPTGSIIGHITAGGTVTTKTAHHFVGYSVISQRLFTMNSSGDIVICDSSLNTLSAAAVTGGAWTCIHGTPTGGAVLTKNHSAGVAKIAMIDANRQIIWSNNFNDIRFQYLSVNQYLPDGGDNLAFWRPSAQIITAGGTIKKLSNGTLSSVTSGTEALKKNAKVIFSAQLLNSVYFADGFSAKYYYGPDESVYSWIPSPGNLPIDSSGARHTLIEQWRNRLVVSGFKQDSTFIAACRSRNPFDFDFAPAAPGAEDAWFDNLPDAVNAVCPYSDDLLIVGCDHSIFQYSGDPTDGGRMDVISDTIGMAWGRPYCRSGSGILYFVGSRGGVYRMVPGTIPEPISSTAINERLAAVDYSTHIIRMAWDDRQQGLYLMITPLDATASTTNYWYDARNNAWWPDSFANASHNPMAMLVVDGPSPDDRRVLMGGRDGYLRYADLTATTDDGTTISSYVFLGPLLNTNVNELQVTLDNNSSSVTMSTHAGGSAQDALAAAAGWSGAFTAGSNRSHYPKRYGAALYLKLAATGFWAAEAFSAKTFTGSAGRLRRST
jgi:hypothetical protein